MDLSTIEARKQIASKYAGKYGIDPVLLCSVIHHESGWYAWASRHEEGFYNRYIQPLVNNGTVKTVTEARNRATSFGLMQIMGQVAREFGCSVKSLTELCDPDTGIEYGCRKLKRCLDSHPADTRAALLQYNGGSDPQYPDLVMQWFTTYKGDV